MAGKSKGVVLAGAGMVCRRQLVLWWIFFVNLLLAAFGTRDLVNRVGETLNSSLSAQRLVKGFDLGALFELGTLPHDPLSTTSPAMVGFGVVFFIFILFLTGGILELYRRNQKLTTKEFFDACGAFFWRFFRLVILFAIIVGILAAGFAGVSAISDKIDERSIPDMRGFWFQLVGGLVILFLLMAVRLWFDMAEVHSVAERETRIRRSIAAGARITWRNFGSLFWLYLRISLVGWAGLALGLWAWNRLLRPESINRAFVLSQAIVLFWLATRLWQRASETLWYKKNCAAAPATPTMPV